jgi:hypothetical protein
MADQLSPREKIEIVRQVYSMLKLLCDADALAGIVLTHDTYEQFKRELGDAAMPYKPSELDLDPGMENSFVAAGVLILKGTKLQ